MSFSKKSLPVVAAMILVPTLVWAEPDEIIVTASPLKGDKIAVPVTQLNQEALDRKGAASIGDLLGDQPGITQSGFATGASRPIIRGLDNFRVRLQENGVSTQGVSALSEDHGAPLDPLSAERVEVLRGPATLRYGSQAIGGVVTVLTHRIPDALPENGFVGDAYGALTYGNGGREAALKLKAGHGDFAFHADGHMRRAQDYDLPGQRGQQVDSFAEAEGFSLGASRIGADGYVGVSGGRYTSTYGIPAAEAPLFIDMRQTRLGIAGALGALSFEGGWSNYVHDEVAALNGDIGSTFRNKEWEARAEYLHDGFVGTEGALGLQLGARDLKASGEGGELLSPARANDFAAFLFEEIPLNGYLNLQLGARAEHVTREGFGVVVPQFDGVALGQEIDDFGVSATPNFMLLSASGGVVAAFSEATRLTAGVQYAERAPAIAELFSKGPHEATETFEIGNPNLGKEKALSAELGVVHEGERARVSLTAFHTYFEDYIFKGFTGFVCGEAFDTCGSEGAPGVEDELTQIAFAQSDARFYGLEGEGRAGLANWQGFQISVEGRFDVVRAKLTGGANIPRIPPMRLGAGLVAESDVWFARLFWQQVFAQRRVAQNELPTKSYRNVEAQLVATPQGGVLAGNVAFGMTGRNLLDAVGRNHVSFKKQDVVLPGREIRLFIRARF